MSKKPLREPLAPESEERFKRVLAVAFLGLHHCDGWERRQTHTGFCSPAGDMMSVTTFQDLATYDGELLTRLVIATHEEAVRVSIENGGFKRLVIRLWYRKREGRHSQRHATIEEAIQSYRRFVPISLDK